MSELSTRLSREPESDVPAGPLYFSVSLTKLVVMSLCTFGLYQPFWLFSQWYYVKEREKSTISLLLRVAFAVCFCYPLFRKIRATADSHNVSGSFSPAGCAVGWTIFVLLSASPLFLFSLLSVLFLLPAQRTVNAINLAVDPEHDSNSTFTAVNKVAIAIGGLFWLLLALGLILSRKQF